MCALAWGCPSRDSCSPWPSPRISYTDLSPLPRQVLAAAASSPGVNVQRPLSLSLAPNATLHGSAPTPITTPINMPVTETRERELCTSAAAHLQQHSALGLRFPAVPEGLETGARPAPPRHHSNSSSVYSNTAMAAPRQQPPHENMFSGGYGLHNAAAVYPFQHAPPPLLPPAQMHGGGGGAGGFVYGSAFMHGDPQQVRGGPMAGPRSWTQATPQVQ